MGKKYGTRQEVFDGLCLMTRGGLVKENLMEGKNGKILSKKKSDMAKASYAKYGFNKRSDSKADSKAAKVTVKKSRRKRKDKDVVA